jgi:hypothetical protein
MATDYGSGLSLSEDLDLRVDATGDILVSDELEELEKDLSFRLISALERERFGILDPATREEIRVTVRNAIIADQRIERIEDITVFDTNTLDEVTVGVTATAGGESVEIVETV